VKRCYAVFFQRATKAAFAAQCWFELMNSKDVFHEINLISI